MITTVVPFPKDTEIPLVAQYQKALRAAAPGARGALSRWRATCRAAGGASVGRGGQASDARRFAHNDQEVGAFDLGGVTLHYSATNNQGMQQVFLTEIQADGTIKPSLGLRI